MDQAWLNDQERRLRQHPFLSAAPTRVEMPAQASHARQASPRSPYTASYAASPYAASPYAADGAGGWPAYVAPQSTVHPVSPTTKPHADSFTRGDSSTRGDSFTPSAAQTALDGAFNDRARADEAVRLWRNAENAAQRAAVDAAALRQRNSSLEDQVRRLQAAAEDEAGRRHAAEASAQRRAKEVAEERWRSQDSTARVVRLDDELARSAADLGESRRCVGVLETRLEAEQADRARAEAAVSQLTAGDAAAARATAREAHRADAADARAYAAEGRAAAADARAAAAHAHVRVLTQELADRGASAAVALADREEAEHDRLEAAKEAFAERNRRDRASKWTPAARAAPPLAPKTTGALGDRARQAEISHAEKAEELLQLWQRFK
ncbi:hypothetical protein M885DRAFT_215026 [Pelagophyceae sp. CCMP2097]|nr:hypothetical protein M885DRAFT_215026 [Pelagophyceae sp. CCMP2097]